MYFTFMRRFPSRAGSTIVLLSLPAEEYRGFNHYLKWIKKTATGNKNQLVFYKLELGLK